MTRQTISAAIAALLLAGTVAGTADAQGRAARGAARPAAAPAAAAGANAITGPALPGICVYNDDRAISASLVGRAAANRMQQLRAQVTAELSGEQTAIQNEAKALEGRRGSLTPQQLQTQAQPLQQRAAALDNKAQLRSRELEQTGSKALQQIHNQIISIVSSVSASHNCSLLLNGEAVIASNQAMDLTEAVVQQLNARMSTISFDRENLANQAAGGRR